MTLSEHPRQPAIITLATDFGLADAYVGQMKGVILGINRDVHIVDVTHEAGPQQIGQGSFLTQLAWPAFPPDTIHIAVVDPGVGTERLAVAIETERGRFVGPDNGVLSAALPDEARPAAASSTRLPAGHRAFEITNRHFMREAVSDTFHGRDVFAPAAAHLSLGVPTADLGPEVSEIVCLPPFRAAREANGDLSGRVVHIDRYGNAVTDIRATDLPEGRFVVEAGGTIAPGPFRTYAEMQGIGAVVGSSGFLGIVKPEGNAALELDLDLGSPALLRLQG